MNTATKLRLAMAQIDTVVGDVGGNAKKIVKWIDRARDLGADIVSFPELALTGYPPEDLLLQPRFVDANLAALDEVVAATQGLTAVIGFVDRRSDIFNAAAVASDGRLAAVYHKMFLPNYGVFDEFRYFRPGAQASVLEIGPAIVGISICEDIWYPDGPVLHQVLAGGAHVILNISSSPYDLKKRKWRERMLSARAGDHSVIVAYNNLVGGQDELVFDGDSMVFDERGELIARGLAFEEDLVVVDLDLDAVFRRRLHDPRSRQQSESSHAEVISISSNVQNRPPVPPPSVAAAPAEVEEIYRALVLGTRDYVRKNGFGSVVLGLSGGIDSALTACIAVDALGSEHVVGVLMPSEYSSSGSVDDSLQLAERLGIRTLTLPITEVLHTYERVLAPTFQGRKPDVTEENLQARIRGNYLMSLSNKFGWLVLSTGNKSEVSTGYCTLYGDMAGGFAVIKDVMKTRVYELARHVNRSAGRDRIPEAILTKPPSAELRPNQLDSDSLPPYDVLDPILRAYVEEDRSLDEIVQMGYTVDNVKRVIGLVDANEYKRRQAAPGVKITPRAFGRDRRMPITNRFR